MDIGKGNNNNIMIMKEIYSDRKKYKYSSIQLLVKAYTAYLLTIVLFNSKTEFCNLIKHFCSMLFNN